MNVAIAERSARVTRSADLDGACRGSQKQQQAIRIRLLLKNVGFAALTYAAMVLYAFELLPLWGLVLANVLFYIRAYLRMHDLCHAFSTRGLLIRFVPTALYANPVWGGVAPFITTHVQHHQYLGSNLDPWLPYYTGHPLRALLFNMIEPEVNLKNYVVQRGWSRPLLENLVFDLARHALNLFVFQGAYLAHVLIQRICHGLGVFLFNFWPHRETWSAAAPLGCWNREREIRPYAWLAQLCFGRALTEAAMYHNRHHVLGQIREPSHRYALLSDEGTYTRFNHDWPLRSVQSLAGRPEADAP
jgi:hypothetical protein